MTISMLKEGNVFVIKEDFEIFHITSSDEMYKTPIAFRRYETIGKKNTHMLLVKVQLSKLMYQSNEFIFVGNNPIEPTFLLTLLIKGRLFKRSMRVRDIYKFIEPVVL